MILGWLASFSSVPVLAVIGAIPGGIWLGFIYDDRDAVLAIIGAWLGAVVGMLVWAGACMTAFLLSGLTHPTTTYQNMPIASLQDSTQTAGSFFLGIGSIDGTPTYAFYTDNNGAYQFHTADAPGIRVYQDTTSPYVVKNIGCVAHRFTWLLPCVDGMEGDYIALHVPKGTIKVNYNLDAKN